jgi:uncharacterized protein with PQ loop repeat
VSINDLVGSLASVVTGIQFIPQIAHLLRKDQRGGVSISFWFLMALQGTLWVSYAICNSLLYVGLVNALVAGSSLLIFSILLHDRGALLLLPAPILGFGLALFLSTRYLPAPISGSGAVWISVLGWLLQVRRATIDHDVHGLSLSSWLLALCSSLLWFLHGTLLHDHRVQTPAFVGALASLWLILRIITQKREQ